VTLFVDTSALLAFLDADQPRHSDLVDAWRRAIDDHDTLVTSNYVLVETFALVQRRLGLGALRALAGDILPLLQQVWVDEELHAAASAALFTAGRRKLSLVDCTSFELMRRHGITNALSLDADFARQGFQLFPLAEAAT
jgi:predicted nucleic acid-binding protein